MKSNDSTVVSGHAEPRLSASRKRRTLMHHMCNVIMQLKQLGKERTSETYLSALNSFMLFRHGRDIQLNRLSADIMQQYEAWLKERGLSMNTSSFYMRILRASYNRAVERRITKQLNPFRHVYTGIGKTVKRAVGLKEIKLIKELDLSGNPSLDYARDMFLFSFYTRGMSFIDMAYLRKTDLKNGILCYRRRKTRQTLYVKWEKCMQRIIDKYPPNDTIYLLPIITRHGRDRQQYQNALRLINGKLKKVAVMAGMKARLTMYVSRHSWASIAHAKHIPLSIISEGMGHDNEATTQIYLTSLDTSAIDRANELIIKSL